MRELEKEGVRKRERSVKQPSLGPRFTGLSHLRKGQLGVLGSALSVIRRCSGISFVSSAPGQEAPRKGQPTGCALCNPGAASELARTKRWQRSLPPRVLHVPLQLHVSHPKQERQEGYRMGHIVHTLRLEGADTRCGRRQRALWISP